MGVAMLKHRFSPAQKIALVVLIIGMLGGSYMLSQRQHELRVAKVNPEVVAIESSATPRVMLASGIATVQGILKTVDLGQHHGLTLNGKLLKLQAVSPIELVQAFVVEGKQVLLLSYDQGGNLCSVLYQLITIDSHAVTLTQPFGSCLPISQIEATSQQLTFKMPQNNPYLGADVLLSYHYRQGKVMLQRPVPAQNFAGLSAAKILAQAAADGCYVNGVMLEDNACGAGRKYCVMLQHLTRPLKDQAYQTLANFCN